jgi:hypothetical protein
MFLKLCRKTAYAINVITSINAITTINVVTTFTVITGISVGLTLTEPVKKSGVSLNVFETLQKNCFACFKKLVFFENIFKSISF